jgi:hypothetical protein
VDQHFQVLNLTYDQCKKEKVNKRKRTAGIESIFSRYLPWQHKTRVDFDLGGAKQGFLIFLSQIIQNKIFAVPDVLITCAFYSHCQVEGTKDTVVEALKDTVGYHVSLCPFQL